MIFSQALDREAAYRRVRATAGFWDESEARARIRVTGKDRAKFLQNMTTQDVKALAPGRSALACALTVKAKLVADFRVHALEDHFLLDVDAARAGALVEHLRKFVVVNQVVFEDRSAATGALAVEGPRAAEAAERARVAAGDGAVVARFTVSGEEGFRVYAPRAALEAAAAAIAGATGGAGPVPAEVVEVLRVENGSPRFGLDLDEATLPPESDFLNRAALSYTKGCYLGQEPIARIHFLGHVNKKLMGLVGAGAAPGYRLHAAADGREVGRVTSGAFSIGLGAPVALGSVRREFFAPGTRLRAGAAGPGAPEVEVRALPLVAPTAPPPEETAAAPVGPPGALKPGASGPAALMPGGAPS